MELALTGAAGAFVGATAGIAIGLRIRRGQVNRLMERLGYAVPELIRRKSGALKADRDDFRRIDGRRS